METLANDVAALRQTVQNQSVETNRLSGDVSALSSDLDGLVKALPKYLALAFVAGFIVAKVRS